MKILIAEDELQNQKLLQRIISKMGFESDVVEDGMAVVNTTKQYNLLILDLSLPQKDGLETAKAIRNGETGHPIDMPIILVSGKSAETMQQYCRDYYLNDYIEKPFGLDDLKTKIIENLAM